MSDMTTQETENPEKKVSRREFLKYGAVAAAVAASSATILGSMPEIRQEPVTPTSLPQTGPASSIEEITIAQIQAMFAAGTLTAKSLVNSYLSRITALDQNGPELMRIQLGIRSRNIGQPHHSLHRHGDRWEHRMSREPQRRSGHQTYRRTSQPCRNHTHLTHPRHSGSTRADGN